MYGNHVGKVTVPIGIAINFEKTLDKWEKI
jgi:hypothetical protein